MPPPVARVWNGMRLPRKKHDFCNEGGISKELEEIFCLFFYFIDLFNFALLLKRPLAFIWVLQINLLKSKKGSDFSFFHIMSNFVPGLNFLNFKLLQKNSTFSAFEWAIVRPDWWLYQNSMALTNVGESVVTPCITELHAER